MKILFVVWIFDSFSSLFRVKTLSRVQNAAFAACHLAYSPRKRGLLRREYRKSDLYFGEKFRAVDYRRISSELIEEPVIIGIGAGEFAFGKEIVGNGSRLRDSARRSF